MQATQEKTKAKQWTSEPKMFAVTKKLLWSVRITSIWHKQLDKNRNLN